MKQDRGIGGLLLGGAVVLMGQAPVWAQATQVTGVQVRQSNQGIEVFLETRSGERPQIFTVSRGNDLVADVINTQLRLPQGNVFRQDNPYPGIASVVVTQLDANSVRVIVAGTTGTPSGQIAGRDSQGILFSFTPGAGAAAGRPSQNVPPPPPGLPSINPGPMAQTPPGPAPNVLVPNPEVTINGVPATPPMTNVPPAAAGPSAAPPFLPRAVAPPVGDIAAATTDSAASTIDLGSNQRVPRLVLKDAPVREVLSLLAREAGLNLAFTAEVPGGPATGQPAGQPAAPGGQAAAGAGIPTISLDIENESVQDIFNYVLRLSGLQANRIGRTIFVGSRLPNELSDVVIRTYRLNQVTARQASGFLASMGAESAVTSTQEVTQVTAVPIQGTDQAITRTNTTTQTTIDTLRFNPQDSQAVLRGLQVLVDTRLNSVTLVGPRRLVEMASSQLVQLDLRRRQVAVNVKIIDVNLSSVENFNSSFSFGIGDTFFVNDNGAAAVNFGGINPPRGATITDSITNPPIVPNPLREEAPFFDTRGTINVPFTGNPNGVSLDPRPPVSRDPLDVGLRDYTPATRDAQGNVTAAGSATFSLFPFIQYPKRFLSLLQAQVVSGNAKILTDPTLVVQEGETATVNLTQDVISNIEIEREASEGLTTSTTTAELAKAGLILGIRIDRIDDNGFITLNVTPKVTSVGAQQEFEDTTISLLAERSLSSGAIRLRDGQTLILSGIIQEQDRVTATKIPLLGDLPIIGALFRSTERDNERAEVIVVLTPQIMDDSELSPFGYGYTPGPDVRPLIQRQMLPEGNSR
ncbi:AMIN domain-containing protein [Microcoleus sp. FACHB-672]|uniref:AMIN domain-containing protein n=1 Tax=Microcoleus sp. FACHB-672 TaxID=2692825 RepID=UPI001682B7AA|nr:AMIN domain-containing protein [Microcoleus sp. FACHB-672]MBD2041791.1 AMIN domain-containing protein [Microcoleus sp. FACHB-672]